VPKKYGSDAEMVRKRCRKIAKELRKMCGKCAEKVPKAWESESIT